MAGQAALASPEDEDDAEDDEDEDEVLAGMLDAAELALAVSDLASPLDSLLDSPFDSVLASDLAAEPPSAPLPPLAPASLLFPSASDFFASFLPPSRKSVTYQPPPFN